MWRLNTRVMSTHPYLPAESERERVRMPNLNLNLDLLSGSQMIGGLLGVAGDLFNFSPSTPATSAPSTSDTFANVQVQVLDSNDTLLYSASPLGILPSWLNLAGIAPGDYEIHLGTKKGKEDYTVPLTLGDADSTQETSNSVHPLTGTAADEGTAPAQGVSPPTSPTSPTDSFIAAVDPQPTQIQDALTGNIETVSPDAGSTSDSTPTAESASNPQVAPAPESQTPPPSTESQTAPAPEPNPVTSETEPVDISSDLDDSDIIFQVQDNTGTTALAGFLQQLAALSRTCYS